MTTEQQMSTEKAELEAAMEKDCTSTIYTARKPEQPRSDDCREAFEKWNAQEGHRNLRIHNGEYLDQPVQHSWKGWQAAWNARTESGLVKELVEALTWANEVMSSYTASGNDEDEWNNDDVIECLELLSAVLAKAAQSKPGPV
jgi:hypothetical protein